MAKQLVTNWVRNIWRQKGETWIWAEDDTVVDAWSSSSIPQSHLSALYLWKGECSSPFSLQHLIPFHYESLFSLTLPKGDPRRLHLMRSVRSSSKRWTKPWCVDINRDAVLSWCHNGRKHIVPHCLILPLPGANWFPHPLHFFHKNKF